MHWLFISLSSLLVLGLSVPSDATTTTTKVTLPQGVLRGNLTDGVATFMGIPFAAPPVGSLRWKPPKDPLPWSGVRDARFARDQCPQTHIPGLTNPGKSSEDCLFLNIWSPNWKDQRTGSGPPQDRYPVLVWIHGGGFAVGDSWNDGLYDGQWMTKNSELPTVLVTINYRLNIFGFAAGHGTSGNYGLMDQTAALRWVKNNIKHFNGDPDKVTIFGQSAGGASACLHQVIPASAGLFQAAIVESGPCVLPDLVFWDLSARRAEKIFQYAMGRYNCTTLDCMQALSTHEIMAKIPTFGPFIGFTNILGWWPMVDGDFIPENPNKLFATGKFYKVPTMVGTVTNEGSIFPSPARDNFTHADLERDLPHLFEPTLWLNYSMFWNDYKTFLPQGLTPGWQWSHLSTDLIFQAGSDQYAIWKEQHYPNSTWYYHWSYRPAFANYIPIFKGAGVAHTMELFFLFNSFGFFTGGLTSAAEKVLATRAMNTWTAFAHFGDFNDGYPVTWEPYSVEKRNMLNFTVTPAGTPLSSVYNYKKDVCDFIRKKGFYTVEA